jgi:hypothetical protein
MVTLAITRDRYGVLLFLRKRNNTNELAGLLARLLPRAFPFFNSGF